MTSNDKVKSTVLFAVEALKHHADLREQFILDIESYPNSVHSFVGGRRVYSPCREYTENSTLYKFYKMQNKISVSSTYKVDEIPAFKIYTHMEQYNTDSSMFKLSTAKFSLVHDSGIHLLGGTINCKFPDGTKRLWKNIIPEDEYFEMSILHTLPAYELYLAACEIYKHLPNMFSFSLRRLL